MTMSQPETELATVEMDGSDDSAMNFLAQRRE